MLQRRHMLSRPWGRLAVWVAGTGPPLVAIHGLGGSGRYWQELAALLADRYTVVAPDLGGFGHSDKPDVAYDQGFHLDDVAAVISGFAPDTRVALTGHSLGGVLAAMWAAQHPDQIAALAIVAAPFPRGRAAPARPELVPRTSLVRAAADRGLAAAWPLLTLPVRSRTFPRAVVADYGRHTRASYRRTLDALYWHAGPAAVEGLRAVAAPALILSAHDDRRVPAEDTERWRRLLPGARSETVAGGHQLLLRGGFGALAAFFAQLPRPQS